MWANRDEFRAAVGIAVAIKPFNSLEAQKTLKVVLMPQNSTFLYLARQRRVTIATPPDIALKR